MELSALIACPFNVQLTKEFGSDTSHVNTTLDLIFTTPSTVFDLMIGKSTTKKHRTDNISTINSYTGTSARGQSNRNILEIKEWRL